MKTVVIYKTVFGATKQYARWVAEFFGIEPLKFSEINKSILSCADRVVVMSGVYAGGMPLIEVLESDWSILKDKKVYVIAVGCVSEDSEESRKSYEKISEEIRNQISYYKIMGAMPFSQKEGRVEKKNLEIFFNDVKNSAGS